MGMLRLSLDSVSRFFISACFLAGAGKNVISWSEAENSLLNALLEWQSHFVNFQEIQVFFSFLMSWSWLLLLVGVALSFLGGLSLLFGIHIKIGLYFLCLFLFAATMLFHPFWWVDGSVKELQCIMFLKNLSIFGCLLQFLTLQNASYIEESVQQDPQDYSPMGY